MKFNKPRLIVAIVLMLAIIGAYGYYHYLESRVHVVRLATSKKGNLSNVAGNALATIVNRENPHIRLEVVETKGSSTATQLLQEGKADMAFVENNNPVVPDIRVMANVYTSIFHLIVPKDSPIKDMADLKGKRVGVPSIGGGSYIAFMTLLKYYDLKPEDFASFENLSSKELPQAFLEGRLDAMFASDPIGIERQAVVLNSGKARLVPIDQGDSMRLTLPYIETVTIPKGAYKADPPIPSEDLQTVGIQTALLARKQVDNETAQEITRLLFDYRLELAAAASQLNTISSPLDSATLSIPVHEGALAFYNRDKPSFLQENADFVALLITVASMSLSGLMALSSRLSSKKENQGERQG